MTPMFNVIYIGFGPATIFSILKFPSKNILVIEKGKSLKNRDLKEVISGSGGAGAFSDSKLVANPVVGGGINDVCRIPDKLFYRLSDEILSYYNYYSKGCFEKFEWMPEDPYKINSKKLKLLKSKVCHIGTDRSKRVFQNIEEQIQTICPINFEEEVEQIIPNTFSYKPEKYFTVITNKGIYQTKNVVLAVGKRSNLVENLKTQLKLSSNSNKIQLGVRVEVYGDSLKELVDKFYDFKLVMRSRLGRWRTFCVNSGSAHVVIEKGEGFVSANGHAYADKKSNGLTNFGIMGELILGWSRGKQIELMKKVNGGTDKLLAQNISDFEVGFTSKKLENKSSLGTSQYRLDNLWNYYPRLVCIELLDFITELKKNYKLSGHIFAPEIKLTNSLIKMDNNFQIYPGIYLAGDCSGYTRSIVQSGISGMAVGQAVYNEED